MKSLGLAWQFIRLKYKSRATKNLITQFLMTLVVAGLIILPAQRALGTITVSDITNASNVTGLDDDDEEALVIFGGSAGDAGAGTGTGSCAEKVETSTCNNCGETFTACNERRIHDNLLLQIELSSDSKTGDVIIADSDGDTQITGELNAPNVTSGSDTALLSVRWSSICCKRE